MTQDLPHEHEHAHPGHDEGVPHSHDLSDPVARPRDLGRLDPGGPLRIGLAGPVGAGKTACLLALCEELREVLNIGVVTNDIYTQEDAEFLLRQSALAGDRVIGVATGGCPHAAIREDTSLNTQAFEELARRHPGLDLLLIESGGDNLAATFSPELVDRVIYVIDVAGGDKIPRKGGPGIRLSDLLVINKRDLAPFVGADLGVMERDATAQRGERPFLLTSMKDAADRQTLAEWVQGELAASGAARA